MDGYQESPTELSYDVTYVMRSSLIKEDDLEQWKYRRAAPLEHITTDRKLDRNLASDSFNDETHTRIFASLVPDEIIYSIGDYSRRTYEVVYLFGDVSGFTDLCEKYNKTGKGGPSRLTQVLNNYIGAMVQEIMSHGGDVLKFSGDAFLAMWKVTENLSMKDAVHQALDCSLVIQKTYGRYQADVDVIIRVKLAISAGNVVFSLIGNERSSQYFCFGPPVTELKSAEALTFAGDIIVTRTAWQHVNANEYLAEEISNGLYAKVFGVGPNWRSIQRNVYTKEDTYSVLTASQKISAATSESSLSEIHSDMDSIDSDDNYSFTSISQVYTSSDQYALRPAVNAAVRLRMKEALKPFILAPVERGITSDEPIEYLTEMRQVTVLFINCKVSYDLNPNICIDIANAVYLTVTRLVDENHGCVNKVNMFDKDLMLLVIFGLRGLKHELESQAALKCATECHQELQKINKVKGVSVGVTTGKTYCGAFGHTLRREYTVISLTVNKAARIMVAYPDKVTCDRETFLHSKLEPRNFILQPYKHLKGIANPGPIYEFKEVQRTGKLSIGVSSRPLLGREQETELYLHLLGQAKENSKNNPPKETGYTMLIVNGESRQGKTRLLEEMVYCTYSEIPTVRFNLTKKDYQIPYQTTRLILNDVLRINNRTTMDEKHSKIIRRLRGKNVAEDQYHLLNDVLDARFPVPRHYDVSDKAKNVKNLRKIFKVLCYSSFLTLWVIAIDDSEYIDDASWMFIDVMINLNCAFIVGTMGLRSYISHLALEVLKDKRVKVVQMKSIDKWFHIGVACQMLNVEAIPPELEKVIQLRSNGNPGWIESFLISLVQSSGLFLKEITRKAAYDTGLLMPPLYMMLRLSPEEINLWTQIMEEATSADDSTRWKMYVDSCRESYPDLTIAQSLREKFDLYNSIKVCVLNPSFNLDDVDPELSMDVLILKTFDSLTSFQQLLLKCSAVLGTTFPRAMLMYIMATSAVKLTALAVKKLFEIHVLTCAKGDFVDGGLVFKERLKNPNEDWTVQCQCKGLYIDEYGEDLPKYAFCGYMRFRSSTFRETTYNLLTDNQKREFHTKAIRYLEKETRRCRTCGNGYFTRYTGANLDYDLRFIKKKKPKLSLGSNFDAESFSSATEAERTRSSMLSLSPKFSDSRGPKESLRATSSFGWATTSSYDDTTTIDTHIATVDWFGLRMVKRCQNDYNITRTFSDVDFAQCTCILILNTMYSQLIEHCTGSGDTEKKLNFMIEYAYLCIEYQNVPHAFIVLKDALMLLGGPMSTIYKLEWMVQLKQGKVYTIIAGSWLRLRHYSEVREYLNQALRCYETSYPKWRFYKYICFKYNRLKQLFGLYGYPVIFHARQTDDTIMEYWNDVSEVYRFFTQYYMGLGKWEDAKLSATYSLEFAIASASSFYGMCMSFCHMLIVSTYFGNHYTNVALEVYALKMCNRKRSLIEPMELKAVSRLYSAIFFARLVRSEIDKAMHIGYLLWRISVSTRMMFVLLKMLPMLVQVVLYKVHVIESGNMLREILAFSNEDMDNSAKAWFFGMCICYHLETGLIVETYQRCISFTHAEGQEPTLRDPDSKRRLITSIWLWNVRTGNWEDAFIWQESAWEYEIKRKGETTENLITALYLLEGLLVYMVAKMDRKNIKAADKAQKMIDKWFSDLFAASKFNKLIIPRLYHLKAYYKVAKDNNYSKAFRLLKKASFIAKKYGNDLEEAWITHSQQAWGNKLPKSEKLYWDNHADEENYTYYLDFDELSDRLGQYTLPVPLLL